MKKNINQKSSVKIYIQLTCFNGNTRKAPPPAASITMATNFEFTAQKLPSHEFFDIRILS